MSSFRKGSPIFLFTTVDKNILQEGEEEVDKKVQKTKKLAIMIIIIIQRESESEDRR